MSIREAQLVLTDGTVFEGEAIGATPDGGVAAGEVVFNTALSGYQEIVTDPSYAGQIITFTYTHIGNYGVVAADDQSPHPFCRGVVVRDLSRRSSNWRATDDLDTFLRRHGVPGIAGIDTRRLTRHIRDAGAMPGAFGTATESELLAAAQAEPGTDGVDLTALVTCRSPYTVTSTKTGGGTEPLRVVAVDYGIKAAILRQLAEFATVEVVPASSSAADILAHAPDGIFLSNGPGDPAMVVGASETIAELAHSGTPLFGICLGHQLLSRALGGTTYKLPFGHHGGNHPVRNLRSGKVEITSQNHNFCVDASSLEGVAELTHVNLNDDTVEGLRFTGAPVFSVQYHPEAGPGPHDARYLFAEFRELMEGQN
jgi:carbamoyl-phosphate synthase small subunit